MKAILKDSMKLETKILVAGSTVPEKAGGRTET